MNWHEILKLAGGLLALALFVPLLADALRRGGAGQSFATWILWAALDAILAASIIRQHGNYLIVLGFTIGDCAMAGALLWKRRATWGRFERVVLALVLGCLAAWKASGPRGATVCATAAICLAGLPGLAALWKNPDRHVAKIWALYALANAVSFFGGTTMTLEERFAPGVFAVFSLALAAAGFRQKR
jgi:uncharacterized membrane protein YqaE (UPF0057 family)